MEQAKSNSKSNARVYLDWASAAPVSEAARQAFLEAIGVFGNPSSPHAEGDAALVLLEESRTKIARLAGVRTEGVIFTSGATESNSLAILGHARALTVGSRSGAASMHNLHFLYLPTAHASVIETMHELEREGAQIEVLRITDGKIDLAYLATQIRPETALISMDAICGEMGTRFNTRDVRRVIDASWKKISESHVQSKAVSGEKMSRALLHVDASQAPFVESFEHTHLGADLITLDAQKVGGVRGIGALIRANTLVPLAPILFGGGQEFGLRSGTESPALAVAFAEALSEAASGRETFVTRSQQMRESIIQILTNEFPQFAVTVGHEFTPHIVNGSFPDIDTDYAVMLLSEAGFAVSTKSACETDNGEGSKTVLALTGDKARAESTLRISWGPQTTPEELNAFAHELVRTIHFLAKK